MTDQSKQDQLAAARALLVERWDSQGACGSCGWHGALYEYTVDDSDLAYALEHDGGVLRLPCLSDDASENGGHRGVRVDVKAAARQQ